MLEDYCRPSDVSRPLQPESLRTFSSSYLDEGLRSGVFDSARNNSNCEFLNGFEISFEPPQTRELPENATERQRRDFIANEENRLHVDIQSMWDRNNRVLVIGDQHTSVDIKQFAADNMRAFREAGATAIGIELFQTRDQHVLDQYREIRLDPSRAAELPEARRAVEALLRQSQEPRNLTEEQSNQLADDAGARDSLNATMRIIDAAIDNGIRPMAIEPPISNAFGQNEGYELIAEGMRTLPREARESFDTFTNPNASEQERAAARAQLAGYLGNYGRTDDFLDTIAAARDAHFDFSGLRLNDTSPEGYRNHVDALHDFRNRYWAESVGRHLRENPDARMVVFAGSQHFNYNQRERLGARAANERLADSGIGSTVLQFAGAEYGRDDAHNAEMREVQNLRAQRGETGDVPDAAMSAAIRYTRPARDAGVADREFALRLQRTREREADFVIHLRQRR